LEHECAHTVLIGKFDGLSAGEQTEDSVEAFSSLPQLTVRQQPGGQAGDDEPAAV
jgi:hypothetical protein